MFSKVLIWLYPIAFISLVKHNSVTLKLFASIIFFNSSQIKTFNNKLNVSCLNSRNFLKIHQKININIL